MNPSFSDFSLTLIPQENGHLIVILPIFNSFKYDFSLVVCPHLCFLLSGVSKPPKIIVGVCFRLWDLYKPYQIMNLLCIYSVLFPPFIIFSPLFESIRCFLDPIMLRSGGYECIVTSPPPFVVSLSSSCYF